MVIDPQKPKADRVYTRFTDLHRAEMVTRALNELRYHAAHFDGRTDTDSLVHLKDAIDKAETRLAAFEERLHDLWVDVVDLQVQIHRLQPEPPSDDEPWGHLSPDATQDEFLDRLAALYKLDPHRGGWKSQNGLGNE
jgi:hypothetical protein